ncbi:MAG: hypothetical protein WCC17_10630 [Candidatus Nitrosopolaris sp.]|jgi:hypothetical protein
MLVLPEVRMALKRIVGGRDNPIELLFQLVQIMAELETSLIAEKNEFCPLLVKYSRRSCHVTHHLMIVNY